jgi:hypothetical protein
VARDALGTSRTELPAQGGKPSFSAVIHKGHFRRFADKPVTGAFNRWKTNETNANRWSGVQCSTAIKYKPGFENRRWNIMTALAPQTHGGTLLAVLLLATMSTELRGQSGSPRTVGVPRIPAISGIVVDALTDRPVGGVDTILRAFLADNGTLRYENSTTSADGRFRFPAKPEPRAAGFLSGIKEISLSVNRVFLTSAQMRVLDPFTSWSTSDGVSDVTWLAQHATLPDFHFGPNSGSESQIGRLDNRSYFPVSVQFLRDCIYEWAPTCLSLSPNTNVRIPLIPVLNNPADCVKIADPENQKRCRELNTYRAAFLHRDTIAQVREDKRICESVDQARVSKQCLAQLHNDVRLSAPPQGSLTPPLGMDSLEDVLILTPVAGLVAGSSRLAHADLFEETAIYLAGYSSATERFGVDPVSVIVDVFSAEPTSKDLRARMADNGGFPPGSEKSETVDGYQVTTLERSASSVVAWPSGRRIVKLEFNRSGGVPRWDRAIAAAAAGWPELILAYLRKYPSK